MSSAPSPLTVMDAMIRVVRQEDACQERSDRIPEDPVKNIHMATARKAMWLAWRDLRKVELVVIQELADWKRVELEHAEAMVAHNEFCEKLPNPPAQLHYEEMMKRESTINQIALKVSQARLARDSAQAESNRAAEFHKSRAERRRIRKVPPVAAGKSVEGGVGRRGIPGQLAARSLVSSMQ